MSATRRRSAIRAWPVGLNRRRQLPRQWRQHKNRHLDHRPAVLVAAHLRRRPPPANVDAAGARYDAAVSSYRATVRNAVSEVEQALVNLDATGARAGDAQTALEGYRANYSAVEDRYKNGMASLFELEDARRTPWRRANRHQPAARTQRRVVALYRAAGGGFTAPTTVAAN
jgi:hypothetical protein